MTDPQRVAQADEEAARAERRPARAAQEAAAEQGSAPEGQGAWKKGNAGRGADRYQELVHAVSHDLQAPVRKMRTFLDLIADEADLEGDAAHYMERAHAAGDRLQTMLDGLLELSRVATQTQPWRRISLDDACAAAWPRGGSLHVDDEAIMGDPRQVERLFGILFDNAVRHAAGRPVVVHVDAAVDGGRVRIEVRDEGPGFDPRLAERVVALFHALDPERPGIGLAVAARIVEVHGGRLSVHPVPDVGTTVRFDLPAARTVDRPAGRAPHADDRAGT